MARLGKFSKVLIGMSFIVAFGLLCSAGAATIGITPDSEFGFLVNTPSNLGMTALQAEINTQFGYDPGTLELLYKAEVGDNANSATTYDGTYASSYTAEFFNDPLDPEDATITYVLNEDVISADFSAGEKLYLIVKTGVHGTYIFNLGYLYENITIDETLIDPAFFIYYSWNGTDTLELTDFSAPGGAISHVSIAGHVLPVPEPATMLLLGTGLIGLAGAGRKLRK